MKGLLSLRAHGNLGSTSHQEEKTSVQAEPRRRAALQGHSLKRIQGQVSVLKLAADSLEAKVRVARVKGAFCLVLRALLSSKRLLCDCVKC